VSQPTRLLEGTVTREQLDRLCIITSRTAVEIGACAKHPGAGTNVLYTDGRLRLLCRSCGVEILRAKVALDSPPKAVLPPGTHARLEAAARMIDRELLGDQATEHAEFLRATAALVVSGQVTSLQDLVDQFEDRAADHERFAAESKGSGRGSSVAAEAFRIAAAETRALLPKLKESTRG
jgi:hypothetical protein